VEWGILMGVGTDGGSRFPSRVWIDQLLALREELTFPVNLCAHLCGMPVIKLLALGELPGYVTDAFQRIQVNTHGTPVDDYRELGLKYFGDEDKEPEDTLTLLKKTGRHFIFQCDGVNEDLVRDLVKEGIGDPLFDTSSGAGMTPQDLGEEWPKIWTKKIDDVCPDCDPPCEHCQADAYEPVYCGYAGGLGPTNVVYQVDTPIRKAVGDGRIWIDMETRIRLHGVFSMAKCEDVLKKMEKFVKGEV
jgi:hypothetical protein